MIFLNRTYLPDGSCTIGKLTVGEWSCLTMEPPWKKNQRDVSCIPEGMYTLKLERSDKLLKITNGAVEFGWHIQNIPGRTDVLFHPGNWVHETKGCPLTGRKHQWTEREGHMVTHSQTTFSYFMKQLAGRGEWTLVVRPVQASWD